MFFNLWVWCWSWSGYVCNGTSKVHILVWILQNCPFKNLLRIEYKYEGCEQFKCTSTYFRFVSLLYLFIWKKVLESNNEQAANTKIKLHSTSNNFLMLFLTRYQAQNLGKKLYSLGKVRIYQCFFSIFGFGECPDVAIDWL